MLQIHAKENKCIDLGRRGEDSAREILFDISGWAELYGQGEAHLIAKRERDLNSYPATITQNNTTVSWVITPTDNDQPGYGNCELVYITDGAVVKSIIYQTHTDVSLSDPVSPPDSPSTYGDLVSRVSDLEKHSSLTHPPKVGENNNWFVWDCEKGEYIDTGVLAEGTDGKNGRDVVEFEYQHMYGFWKVEYSDGERDFYAGVDETYPNRFSFIRDDMSSYELGTDSFYNHNLGHNIGASELDAGIDAAS